MPEKFKPREVYQAAREALGPYLTEQGYKRTKKMGPGPSWERDTERGYLLVGVHAGGYFDLMGGKFQVEFEVESEPLLGGNLLWLLSDQQMVEWKNLAWPVYGRAFGVLPGGEDDADLKAERRELYEAIGVTDWRSTEPGLGFPWFGPEDLAPQLDFIKAVLPEAEARMLRRAGSADNDR